MISRKDTVAKIYKRYPFAVLGKTSAPRVLQGIVGIINSMPDEDKWINTADKLPDKDTLVLLKFDKDEYNRIHNGNYQNDFIIAGVLKDNGHAPSEWFVQVYFDYFEFTSFPPVQWKKINL